MRKMIVNEFISLDGVAQAPGGADEDTSGGFAYGGWHMRYMEDELAQRWVLEASSRRAASCWGVGPTRSSRPTGRTRPRRSR